MIPYSGALNPNSMESMHLALAHTETVERWRSALRMGRVNRGQTKFASLRASLSKLSAYFSKYIPKQYAALIDAPCPERKRLLHAYIQAAQAFSEISTAYLAARSSQERGKFLANALNAKTLVDIAQTAIDVHTAEHGCGVNPTRG
jgi:hypothetical protein